jgi:hypothetical protein
MIIILITCIIWEKWAEEVAWTDRDSAVSLLPDAGAETAEAAQDNCQPNRIPAPLLHSCSSLSLSLSHFLHFFCIPRFEHPTVPKLHTHWGLTHTQTSEFLSCPVNYILINYGKCSCLSNHAQRLLYVPPGLTFTNSTFCPHSVFMCFVWISEQTATFTL